jgi:hypothetical protein
VEQPAIYIRRKGAGFVVAVEPPDPAHPPAEFADKRVALGAAGGLRLVTGWRKLDLTGAA